MRITSQLKLTSAVMLTAMVMLTAALTWSFLKFEDAKNNAALADMIKINFFERTSFRDQYFLYRENHAHEKWVRNKESSDQLLHFAERQFHSDEDLQTIKRLQVSTDEATAIFQRIVGNSQVLKTARSNRHVYEELDKRLFSQLLLKDIKIRDTATILENTSAQRVELTYRRLSIFTGLFALILALATILVSTYLGRLIRKRLTPLHNGAKIVADGDLNYRIQCDGADEFTELAQSINAMTEKLNEEITLRKDREERLIEAQTIAKLGSWHVVFGKDESQDTWDISNALRRLYGHAEDAKINTSTGYAAMPPEDQALTKRYWADAKRGAGPTEWEHRIIVNGEIRWMHVSAKFILDDLGNALEAKGTNQDITERKLSEVALHEKEARFRSIIETSPVPYVLNDDQQNITYLNTAFTRTFGYTLEDIPTLAEWWLVAYPDLEYRQRVATSWKNNIEKAHIDNKPFEPLEINICCKDGSVRTALVGASPIGTSFEGTHLVTLYDITERKKMELALRKSEARSRAMLETELLGIVMVKDRIIQWANPAFEHMLGYEKGDLVGKSTRQNYLSDEAYRTFGEAAYPVLHSGNIFRSEIEHRCKDGRHIWVDVSGTILNQETDESIWGFIDMTDRVKFEQELKRSNDELEQFSYAISHDMRQPLRMITSYLQLIQMNLAEKLDSSNREFFGFAIDGAKRLDQMLLGMLDYSRVGRKNDPFDWEDSRTLLDDTMKFFTPMIAETQAAIEIAGEWPKVRVSRDEIMRLMQNLLGNALKYRVTGRTPHIHITSQVENGIWRLCVKDNGIGIDPTQVGRLFQVFQRLQARSKFEGNGIGLALCRKIAEHHGGRIWAESAGESQGSAFCVEIKQE